MINVAVSTLKNPQIHRVGLTARGTLTSSLLRSAYPRQSLKVSAYLQLSACAENIGFLGTENNRDFLSSYDTLLFRER